MDDTTLIAYCDIHSETPRALFSAEQVNRMAALAGVSEDRGLLPNAWYSMHEEMKELVRLARANREGGS